MDNKTNTVLDPKTAKAKYHEAKVIVFDDNSNSFQHVANCLLTITPGMSKKRSWDLAVKVDMTSSAKVLKGTFEQAGLYHQQLLSNGLTMSPIERT